MNFLEAPVIIKNFPVPPSDNDLKKPVRRYAKGERKGGRKVLTFMDSEKYILYKSAINLWWSKYCQTGKSDFEKIRCWANSGKVLGIVCDFRIHHDRMWTKDGRLQRIDAPNRLKALHDTFTKLVGIDDKVFTKTTIEKVEVAKNLPECFYLIVGPIEPRKEQNV